jgi:hypothetical protein
MGVSPLAGKPAPQSILVRIPRLVSAYYTNHPDPSDISQLVEFGPPATTEDIYKIYTESFKSREHLLQIQQKPGRSSATPSKRPEYERMPEFRVSN